MPLTRRSLLAASAASAALCLLPRAARAAGPARLADLSLGRDGAPVTILEYSSYTCPHCATFHIETRPWLVKTYVDTGRARMVFSDFPLDGVAMAASMLVHSAPKATAAALSEALFSEQRHWAAAQNPREALTQLAALAGMSAKAVETALADKELFQALMDQREKAEKDYGVDSTPTLVINGHRVAANSPRKDLAAAIEAAEAEAKRKS
ncbi:thioredoxin domain-containing protein [Oleispirillum naphthae]|uniref:thioredoxin domain-containing protein n=1 Tax=Oleispirillum naphthae TaxID=2838853 RepID=UPI003082205F